MKWFIHLVVGTLLAGASTVGLAANEVKLLKVQSVVSTRYGMSSQQPRFDVLVENLAYAKQVAVQLKNPDGTTQNVALTYSRPADANREIWSGSFYQRGSSDLEFSVTYTVNGVTYVDDNGGQNYKIARDSGTVLFGKNVYDGNYSARAYKEGTQFRSWVTTKNFGTAQAVKVVYSTNGWASSTTVNATYSPGFWNYHAYSSASNPNAYGFKEWNFTLYVGAASQVQYKFYYVVDGQTYVDDNFGRNYRSSF